MSGPNKESQAVRLSRGRTSGAIDRARRPEGKSKVADCKRGHYVFLDTYESDKREAVFVRRLDLLARQLERLDRDLSIAVDALALFIRFSLAVAPMLPDSAAAQAKGRERFESFLEALGQRLANGQSLPHEVSIEKSHDSPLAETARAGLPSSRKGQP